MQRGLDLSQSEAGNSLSPSPGHLQGDKAAEVALRALEKEKAPAGPGIIMTGVFSCLIILLFLLLTQ